METLGSARLGSSLLFLIFPLSLGFIALYYFMLSFNSIRIMTIVCSVLTEEGKLRIYTQTYVPSERARDSIIIINSG